MLISNHVVQGAVVGAVAPGPVPAFLVGVVTHAVADSVPHWGGYDIEDVMGVAVADGLVGLALLGYLAKVAPSGRRTTVVAGMLGACLPDADKPSTVFLGRSPFPAVVDEWHGAIQTESPRRMPQEVVLATLGLLVARSLLRRAARPRLP